VSARGFTLIEIALVVAILCVLAALIFAAYGPAREAARERTCVSNLHQIGLAIAQYRTDHDGEDPAHGERLTHAAMGLPSGAAAATAMDSYIKSRDVQKCPSFHDKGDAFARSYEWPALLDESLAPERDLPGQAARLGMSYPLVACQQHNAALDFDAQPRWAKKKVVLLQLSQAVVIRRVPARESDAFRW
jgi:prepilin-type N-terminal cleavage/methylation domain-containing protein